MNTVVAVDNVTFNAYKGEITALLGHNGAGKAAMMRAYMHEKSINWPKNALN